ncbi:hypothetical protein GLW08_03945 [Pontibacillus yanchengensis]|uniref:DUF4309 domain-containing protein n=2 Tax=Pontibacillus yanchengensis TaxID=462910 RepID=A0A6I5A4A4_9BACI|nr:hypothetical protein [Pontibacillus yanchengensis]MYL35146.1 hypothetical protein [Pontibacillus yanchengensis]MYL52487.1 hypothetical protein [Pontibacillus yanchengensis]
MNRIGGYVTSVMFGLGLGVWLGVMIFYPEGFQSNTGKSDALKEAEKRIQLLQKEVNELKEGASSNNLDIPEEKAFFQESTISRNSITMEQLKSKLGEPLSIEKYNSIKGLQYDLQYEKASFTFEKSEKKTWLKSFSITSPLIITQHGITVGDSRENVLKVYGSQYRLEKDAMIYGGKSNTILFILQDDQIKRIQIRYDYE